MNAVELRDDCDHEHLVVKDEKKESKEEELTNLSWSINVDHELEQDQREEMGIYDNDANEFDEVNV